MGADDPTPENVPRCALQRRRGRAHPGDHAGRRRAPTRRREPHYHCCPRIPLLMCPLMCRIPLWNPGYKRFQHRPEIPQQSSCGQETGVRWVEALRGERAWAAHTAGSWEAGGWSAELFEACLCRSQTLAQVRRVSHGTPLIPLSQALFQVLECNWTRGADSRVVIASWQ